MRTPRIWSSITSLMALWDEDVGSFVRACTLHEVRMIMVGGGAVNFHGYQRHSADVHFWIEPSPQNLERLLSALQDIGFDVSTFPEAVRNGEQNISLKFSPDSLDVELITKFSSELSFDEAFQNAEVVELQAGSVYRWRVLSYEDLISSKIRAGRPKDLLDVQELRRRRDT